ncbi:MAG: hypothetical protein SFU83_12655 [Meiothermus sp.]|nr:hypothetical protein [Meiothermus sp.]
MLKRLVQIALLGLTMAGFALLVSPLTRLLNPSSEGARVADDHRAMGHFQPEAWSDFGLSLIAPGVALAQSSVGETVTLPPSAAYTPSASEGTDDYHCFLLDPKLSQDRMVTAVNIQPDAGRIVHHVILFKITGDAVGEAVKKNQAGGGRGWTCFGGPEVGDSRAIGGSWLGAWVPGAGDGRLPEGLGIELPKGSLVVMQVHYNLQAGAKPDQSRVSLTYAPKSQEAGLRPLGTNLFVAPVEVPCADGNTALECSRTNTLRENVKKFGEQGVQLPQALLAACGKSLSDFQKPVGDASAVSSTCLRSLRSNATLYSVAGHMHLKGTEIKLELVRDGHSQTLLHIPRWDFHWQGNYWFKHPVQVKAGDAIRISCTFDNSARPQRYITWGEGTTDEMCLGVIGYSAR